MGIQEEGRESALVANAVRLGMHGEIKPKDSGYRFKAEQVIRWQRGFVRKARVTMKGLPVTGSDRWIDGEGSMRWKLLGLIPIVTAAGPDISRAALGRVDRKEDFHDFPFGGIASGEQAFDGIAIPTVLRVGWRFGEDRFETEGEFFRVAVDRAEFR